MRREQREQVPVAMVRLVGRPFDAREPHGETVAEAEDHVHGPVAGALERKLGPLGKLLRHQCTNERLVDLGLAVVDSHHPNP